MSDATANNDQPDKASDEPLAGARLRAAREEQQISITEIAKELHLDEGKVRALEQNRFESLGAPVFAKGHLRKYGQLVGIDAEQLLSDYHDLNRAAGMPPVVGKVRKHAREITPGPWIAAFVVLLLLAFAYWFFVMRPVAAPAPVVPAVVEQTTAVEPREEVSVPPAVVEESVADPVPEAVVVPPPDVTTLTMAFSGDCWTEITDADGRRLFFNLGTAGRTINVSGRAPLSVLFGNADNVSLEVNGEPYTIAAADRRRQTARFTLQSP